jgi:hypothetical protein
VGMPEVRAIEPPTEPNWSGKTLSMRKVEDTVARRVAERRMEEITIGRVLRC